MTAAAPAKSRPEHIIEEIAERLRLLRRVSNSVNAEEIRREVLVFRSKVRELVAAAALQVKEEFRVEDAHYAHGRLGFVCEKQTRDNLQRWKCSCGWTSGWMHHRVSLPEPYAAFWRNPPSEVEQQA